MGEIEIETELKPERDRERGGWVVCLRSRAKALELYIKIYILIDICTYL